MKFIEWSAEEDKLLMDNLSKPNSELVKLLVNRTSTAIHNRIKKLGLVTGRDRKWSQDDKQYLIDNQEMSTREQAEVLGKTQKGVSTQRRKLGIAHPWKGENKWTPDEISLLHKHGELHTAEELHELGLFPGRSLWGIKQKRASLYISVGDEWRVKQRPKLVKKGKEISKRMVYPHKIDQTITIDDLTNLEYQVLVGSVLGDGCLRYNGMSGYFSEKHGAKQRDYLLWKANVFNRFHPVLTETENDAAFTTPQSVLFSNLKPHFYAKDNSRKSLYPLEHISKMDYLGFLIWYLDDGTNGLNRKTGILSPSIAVGIYDLDGLHDAVDVLNVNLGLNVTVNGRNGRRNIYIPAASKVKCIDNWKQVFDDYELPKCMEYKLGRGMMEPINEPTVPWTDLENEIVMYHENNLTSKELTRLLPNRSAGAIASKRHHMGMTSDGKIEQVRRTTVEYDSSDIW